MPVECQRRKRCLLANIWRRHEGRLCDASRVTLLSRFLSSWQNTWMIQLRDIRQDELPFLVGLCLRSKAVWGYDDAFMTACRTELTLHPDELLSTHLQVAERDTIVVGLAQVNVTGTDANL